MHHIEFLINLILHLDTGLIRLIQQAGAWTYLILFMVIFCETGLVIMPFLPGDSLLFAIGALAARGALDFKWMVPLLIVAAFLGDQLNYGIGSQIGHWLAKIKTDRWYFKPSYIAKTHQFYERHGQRALILARFVPIIRTFAPFTAGLGAMSYRRFILFSLIANVLWIVSLSIAGYLFGNIPLIKEHFTLVVLSIVLVSLIPALLQLRSAAKN